MSDQFPNSHSLEKFDWMGSSYEQQIQIILKHASTFVLVDPEVKNYIFMFLADQIRIQDLIVNLRSNKEFRNLYRDILDYIFDESEEFIEIFDTFDKYMELRIDLFTFRYSAQLDPLQNFPLLLSDSAIRHTWNNFGITEEVIRDFEDSNVYYYDSSYFDKFRLLTKWLLLDLLDYYDSLDTVRA